MGTPKGFRSSTPGMPTSPRVEFEYLRDRNLMRLTSPLARCGLKRKRNGLPTPSSVNSRRKRKRRGGLGSTRARNMVSVKVRTPKESEPPAAILDDQKTDGTDPETPAAMRNNGRGETYYKEKYKKTKAQLFSLYDKKKKKKKKKRGVFCLNKKKKKKKKKKK